MSEHISVLIDRVLETLGDIQDKVVVDATFGAGGYSYEFLKRGANVIAFDRDPYVKKFADKLQQEFGEKFKFINDVFSNITKYLSPATCDAIVFDLGISSMQIDNAERGFSFRFDAPLDMRMNNESKTNATDLIKNSSSVEIANILKYYGDVKKAVVIANAIKQKLPKTTFELRDLIYNPNDVAPVFQALRIAVNDEIGEITRALNLVPELLAKNGICAIVTFHSQEDRLVKEFFRNLTTAPGDPRIPVTQTLQFKLLKTFRPSEQELKNNPRSRSAHLRGIIKTY